MVHAHLIGSKKKTRLAQRDERRVGGLKKRLGRIYELARLIKSEQELDTYLEAIPDETVRAETRKLIEPFLLFECQRVGIVEPEKATIRPIAAFSPMELAEFPLRIKES